MSLEEFEYENKIVSTTLIITISGVFFKRKRKLDKLFFFFSFFDAKLKLNNKISIHVEIPL